MHTIYQPEILEQERLNRWDASNYFSPREEGEAYCIMLPPPNVTGRLHMGHAFQVSIMDALVRYNRMLGKKVLWQGGTDHAGIATQLVIENQLAMQGKERSQLKREKFLAILNAWKEKSNAHINTQLKRLGASIDYSRFRFTKDDDFNQAVIKVFTELYEAGLIYRGKRLVNWDPKLLTAISDLEVTHTEEQGFLYYLRYPFAQEEGYLTVATTRPETLFGDIAVAVHPEDERYAPYIGKLLQLPLTQRTIPIIADTAVEKDFGTGCVKITPAHDFNDYKMAQRHQLDMIEILTAEGLLNEQVPTLYQGMDCQKARKSVVETLQALNLIEKIQPHVLKVPRNDRSGAVVEPYLTEQWFMRMRPLADRAIQAIEAGLVEFVPHNWKQISLQWLEKIEDWCISRQLWWGHRIPVWYDEKGSIFVGTDEVNVRQKYQLDSTVSLYQEDNVLDTWFSSSLWPFVTLGWPDTASKELKTFYPTQVLVTAFDLVFFWVPRMLMLGLHFTQQVPFHKVYFTGLITDQFGQKMSKSKGNGLDPIDIIEGIDLPSLLKKRTQSLMQPKIAELVKRRTEQEFPKGIQAFGADALRLTYYSLASPTRELRFDMHRALGYRNFCNKLWQATRFVCTQYGSIILENPSVTAHYSVFDRWILSRLQKVIQLTHHHFDSYRFDLLSQLLYDFFWHEYCDWYLEFTKPILRGDNQLLARGACNTLVTVLEQTLKLLHPLIPFITEKLWYLLMEKVQENSSMLNFLQVTYPQINEQYHALEAEGIVEKIKMLVRSIRNMRGELKISPSKKIRLYYRVRQPADRDFLIDHQLLIENLAKINLVHQTTEEQETLFNAQQLLINRVENIDLGIVLQEITNSLDKQSEVERLKKEKIKFEQFIMRAKIRLTTSQFLAKAPKEVIEQTRKQVTLQEAQLSVIDEQLEKLQ